MHHDLVFLVLALISGVLGYSRLAGLRTYWAWISFAAFIALAAVCHIS